MIARKSIFILSSTTILQLISAIEYIIIIKFWGDFAPPALGTIGLAISFLAIFNFISDLGFTPAHVKRVSEGKDLGTCIGTYTTIKTILAVSVLIISIISVFIIKNILGGEIYDSKVESILFIVIMSNFLANLISIPITTFTGTKEMVKREFPYIIGIIVGFPIIILIATAGVSVANIPPSFILPGFLQSLQQFIANNALKSLALTYVISMFATLIMSLWFFRRYPIKKPTKESFKSYFTFALPLMLLPIISIIINNVDKLMIGYFWSPVEVGYYFAMDALVNIVVIFPSSVSAVLFPSISEFKSNKNFIKIKQSVKLAERYISMISIFLVIIIIVLARPIISIIMSDAFLPAVPVLIILAIFILIECLNSPFNSLVRGMDRPSVLTKIAIVTSIVIIVLNIMLIPKNGVLSSFKIYGASGAAVATAISGIIAFFGLRIASKRLTGIKLLQSHTLRHIIAGLTMGTIIYFIAFNTTFFTNFFWYHLILFFAFGIIIYFGILFLFKEFNKKDFDFFVDILNPKKMLKYVSSELKDESNDSNKK